MLFNCVSTKIVHSMVDYYILVKDSIVKWQAHVNTIMNISVLM